MSDTDELRAPDVEIGPAIRPHRGPRFVSIPEHQVECVENDFLAMALLLAIHYLVEDDGRLAPIDMLREFVGFTGPCFESTLGKLIAMRIIVISDEGLLIPARKEVPL